MKITFRPTLDEIVDAHVRLYRHTQWRSGLTATIITALLGGLVVYVLMPGPVVSRVIVAVFASAVAIGTYPIWFKRSLERVVRRRCRADYEDEPPLFSIELREDSVWTRTDTIEISFDWSSVEVIEVNDRAIVFLTLPPGIVVVQKRAFSDERVARDFLETARMLRDKARDADDDA